MSVPSSSTDPDSAAVGTSSCIRFRMRRYVDLPHPEGPMSAVTRPGSMSNDTRSSTFWVPNHAETFVVFMLACWLATGVEAAAGVAGGTAKPAGTGSESTVATAGAGAVGISWARCAGTAAAKAGVQAGGGAGWNAGAQLAG